MRRKFLRLRQNNSMYRIFLRLHQKTHSQLWFMNKTDLCSTGGVKTQKCEQTHTRSATFFSNNPKNLIIQCIKPQGFPKNSRLFPKNSRILEKKLKDFPKNSMLRRLPASVGLQKNVQKISH